MEIRFLKKNDRFRFNDTDYKVEKKYRDDDSPLKTECGQMFHNEELDVVLLPKEGVTHTTKDALGQEIVIGNSYGYSASLNGFTIVRLGTAVQFTKTGLLTLLIYSAKRALYNHDLETEEMEKPTISVKPSLLFPITNTN